MTNLDKIIALTDERNILLNKLEAYNNYDLDLTKEEQTEIYNKLEEIYNKLDILEAIK